MTNENVFDNVKVKFEEFLLLVSNVLVHEKEIHLIQNKLRHHFNTSSSSYLCSTDFQLLLDNLYSLFSRNLKSTKYYTLLSTLNEELKKHNIKPSKSHQSSKETSNSVQTDAAVQATLVTDEQPVTPTCQSPIIILDQPSSPATTEIQQTIDQPSPTNNTVVLTSNGSQSSITIIEPTDNSEDDFKRKRKINKLERRLISLSRVIRELEEKDLSLDEMVHSDLYTIESALKKRAYEIYIKLAELKNESSSTERILDEPVILTETEIDNLLISKALQEMVNQTKSLPSFADVFDTIEKTNAKHKLNLNPDSQKTLAEKAFKIVGTKIKERRMADFYDIMNSRLPEDFDIEGNDPALKNSTIQETLLENEREAIEKTEQIFERFSQIDPEIQSEENIDSSEESTDETDEEEKGEKEDDDDDADKNQVESESDKIVDPSATKPDENLYDIVDMLPPYSPIILSPSSPDSIKAINNKDPVKSTVEVLHRASIPLKRARYHPFISNNERADPNVYTAEKENDDDDDVIIQESQSMSIVHTLTPRRRQQQQTSTNSDNAISYSIYRERITTNDLFSSEKRTSNDSDGSNFKKRKDATEAIIFDRD